MSVSVLEVMNVPSMPGLHPMAMARPQIGIERLPTHRISNEPRESMNCKSCRKRKIKCNRLRPSCEACQVFQCPCIYDAVPKKRGPKTDVLEALLKRVDGLEAKLREKNSEAPSPSALKSLKDDIADIPSRDSEERDSTAKVFASDAQISPISTGSSVFSPRTPVINEMAVDPSRMTTFFDTYFSHFHGKPFYILDESTTRQQFQQNRLPKYLCYAICAVAVRHGTEDQTSMRSCEDFASLSRGGIVVDEPSLESLQALLLLVNAYTASGKGKKAYMLTSTAIGMAMALELHREIRLEAPVTPIEQEVKRRLFWTCYLLDRFHSTGSSRPCLINDNVIALKLPSWSPTPSSLPVEGDFFSPAPNQHHDASNSKKPRGSIAMLVEASRILGITNQYLSISGLKGDSHVQTSEIQRELDIWASETEEIFSAFPAIFERSDSTVLALSKLIYHLVHCLIYRPFLPLTGPDLLESGHQHPWQADAVNLCFLHANAIIELVALGSQSHVKWPAFVAYCVFTAGTVHIHGAHYPEQSIDSESAFTGAANSLSLALQQLSELRQTWACVQHLHETLQSLHAVHSKLIKSMTSSSAHHTSISHNGEFFSRYSTCTDFQNSFSGFDVASLSLSSTTTQLQPNANTQTNRDDSTRVSLKRKATASSTYRKRPSIKALTGLRPLTTPGLSTPGIPSRSFSYTAGMMQHSSPGSGTPLRTLPSHYENQEAGRHFSSMQDQMSMGPANHAAVAVAGPAGFCMSPNIHQSPSQGMPALSRGPFSPAYHYTSAPNTANNGAMVFNDAGYNTIFGTMPMKALSSPATWHGEDSQVNQPTSASAAPSPGTRSNNDSIGTGQGDDNDQFLSLLGRFEEGDPRSHIGAQGAEFDFFLNDNGANL